MVDTAHNILIRDVDIRALAVVTLTILVSEFWGAPEIITVLVLGMLWAFLSTPDSKEIVNSTIYKLEKSVNLITSKKLWQKYGRPVSYLIFFIIITGLIIV